MDGVTIHHIAREQALTLPAVAEGKPFGPEWDVFKVKGKVFMLLTQEPGEAVAIVKSAPSDSEALQQEFEEITPGYHMNKRHRITINPGP